MLIRQSANAAIRVVGGTALGALVAAVAVLAMDRRRRANAEPSARAMDPAETAPAAEVWT